MRARVVQRGVVPCGRCSLVVPSWCHGLCEVRAGLWLWCAGSGGGSHEFDRGNTDPARARPPMRL
eukprot:scaffold17935_cov39-Phaeocystis_antarctica.AAC.2